MAAETLQAILTENPIEHEPRCDNDLPNFRLILTFDGANPESDKVNPREVIATLFIC